MKCCIPQCNNAAFVQSRIATSEQIADVLGYCEAPYPTPLCKHHYHLIYDKLQPKQTHCCTCGSPLRTGPKRPCPDPQRIQQYLYQEIGFEGNIPEDAYVCLSCYKSHLQILKEDPANTDGDLLVLINTLKSSTLPVELVKNTDDLINTAMHKTAIYVGESLLHQEALLLPSVHDTLRHFAKELSRTANLELGDSASVTARWVLSNFIVILQHHLSYACRVRKLGTLLYRRNGDLLTSLSLSLHKLAQTTSPAQKSQNSTKEAIHAREQDSEADDINTRIHQQVRHYLAADVKFPYRFDKLNINRLISEGPKTMGIRYLYHKVCFRT